jgi:hypothetical protein
MKKLMQQDARTNKLQFILHALSKQSTRLGLGTYIVLSMRHRPFTAIASPEYPLANNNDSKFLGWFAFGTKTCNNVVRPQERESFSNVAKLRKFVDGRRTRIEGMIRGYIQSEIR